MPKLLKIMNRYYVAFLFSIFFFVAFSQTESGNTGTVTSKKKRGNFYANWGYTRCWYSKSDIHFIDHSNKYHDATGRYNDYDFTIL